jgi:hypothetical protein
LYRKIRYHPGNAGYTGGDFPNVAALKGIHQPQLLPFNDFAKDVENPSYPWLYTFIA